jgi:hypothetical protein
MTRRLIRFPIVEPLETAVVAATELDREQLEQLRDQVAVLLAASQRAEAGAVSVPGGPAGGPAWRGLDRVEVDRAGAAALWAVPVSPGACQWTAPLDLSEGAGSGHPRRGHERCARQAQRLSSLVQVPAEVAHAGGAIADPIALQHRHDEVPHGRHGLRSYAAPNTTGVLTEGDIPHVVQLVLDGPVSAAQAEQVCRSGAFRRQAGDLVVHFSVPVPIPLALVDEPANLCKTRPPPQSVAQIRGTWRV